MFAFSARWLLSHETIYTEMTNTAKENVFSFVCISAIFRPVRIFVICVAFRLCFAEFMKALLDQLLTKARHNFF